MKSWDKSKFYFLLYTYRFPFCLLLSAFMLLGLTSCSNPSETSTGSLSGTVHLENQQDHSGITVALYDLAELDPDIVYANATWPHIGVIINQHTEFDHRLQTPIAVVQTEADGSFELSKIPVGKYNFVAIKDGWGFKYLYEIEVTEGENSLSDICNKENVKFKMKDAVTLNCSPEPECVERQTEKRVNSHSEKLFQKNLTKNELQENNRQKAKGKNDTKNNKYNSFNLDPLSLNPLHTRTSDITLYPETTLSDYFPDQSNYFLTDHHYIIENDTELLPNQYLEIQPGAVIRINPGIDLTIHGTLKAQGQENNMFWVTTNDGFDDNFQFSFFKSPKGDSLTIYNSMELTEFASVADNLIEWGKWSWGNISWLAKINDCVFRNLIFNDCSSGFYVSDCGNIAIENLISKLCINGEYGGIVAFNIDNLIISNSIITRNFNGIYSKFSPTSLIENNYIANNTRGIWGLTFKGVIEHNDFSDNNECDIKLAANTTTGLIDINYNNLKSDVGIWQFEQGSFNGFHVMTINNNNFYSEEYFIKYDSSGFVNDIDATNNYFNGILAPDFINNMIIDTNPTKPESIVVVFEPFLTEEIIDAGIK